MTIITCLSRKQSRRLRDRFKIGARLTLPLDLYTRAFHLGATGSNIIRSVYFLENARSSSLVIALPILTAGTRVCFRHFLFKKSSFAKVYKICTMRTVHTRTHLYTASIPLLLADIQKTTSCLMHILSNMT